MERQQPEQRQKKVEMESTTATREAVEAAQKEVGMEATTAVWGVFQAALYVTISYQMI